MKATAQIGVVGVVLLLAIVGWAITRADFLALVWERLLEFGAPIVAAAIAIALLSMLVIAARRWSGSRDKLPLEPIGFIESLLDLGKGHTQRMLNVECRLSDGTLLVKDFVPVIAHNGMGGAYRIDRGVFFGCDAEHIDVGRQLTVCVGPLRFELSVKWDDAKEVPYVAIPHTRRELIALLNAPAA
jgi:hypothetical protein